MKRSRFTGPAGALIGAFLVAACVTAHDERPRPVAVAGPDVIVALGAPVSLHAGESHLPGRPDVEVGTRWALVVQPAGADLTLSHPDARRLALTPPAPGLYVLRVIAHHDGRESRPAWVNVRVVQREVAPDPEQWTLEIDRERLVADGTATATITARGLRDGVPLVGREVRFTTTAGALEGPVTGLSSGRYLQTLRAPSELGRAEVRLHVDGIRHPVPAFVDFVAGPPHALVRVSGNAQSGQTGEPLAEPLVVAVRDVHGHPVGGAEVRWSVVSGDATVDPLIGMTGSDGRIEATATLGPSVGLHRFEAHAEDADAVALIGSPVYFDASALPGDAHAVALLDGDGQSVLPGETVAAPLRVRVTDPDGNPLEGVPIIWDPPAGGDVEPSAIETDAVGVAATVATAPTVRGVHVFRAMAGDLEGSPVAFEVTVLPGSPVAVEKVAGDGQVGTVGEAAADPLVVRVVDAFGNGVDGVAVIWTAHDGGLAMGESPQTDADGFGRAVATLGTTPGTQRFRATVTDPPLPFGQFELVAEPGPPERLDVTGFPTPIHAGRVEDLTVTSHDAHGNPTPFSGALAVTTDAPSSTMPLEVAVDGEATFGVPGVAIHRAGVWRIDVADASRPEVAGHQSGILVTASDERSTITVTGSPAPADGETPVIATITLEDADGEPVEEAGLVVSASPSGSVGDIEETAPGVYEVPVVSAQSGRATLSFTVEGLSFSETAGACFGILCTPPGAARVRMDVDTTGLTEDLVDFPVLVVLDATRIDYGRTAPGGADLRFVDGEETMRLAHEIERWDPSGTTWIWVRVPRIEPGGTHLWLYFDDPGADDVQDPAGVWDAGFVGVWHLAEALESAEEVSVADSTAHAHEGTRQGPGVTSEEDGAVFRAMRFSGGTNAWIRVPETQALDVSGPALTLEAWVAPADLEEQRDQAIVAKADANTPPGQYALVLRGEPNGRNRHVDCRVRTTSDHARFPEETTAVPADAWSYVACRYDGTTLTGFIDGVAVHSEALTGDVSSREGDVHIGRRHDDRRYQGGIDEVRISSVARSDAWIAFQHRSMSDDLLSFGPIEDVDGGE